MKREHRIESGVEKKYCFACKEWVAIPSFNKCASTWDGLQKKCTPCRKRTGEVARRLAGVKKRRIEHIEQNGTILKHCSKCEGWYPLISFFSNSRSWDGKAQACKKCVMAPYKNNPIPARQKTKEWYRENKEKATKYRKEYFSKPENKERINKRLSDRRKDPIVRLRHIISTGIRDSLKRGKVGYRWESLVGYDVEKLMVHLEKHFLPGMAWENRNEWHIDHKIPQVAFNFQTPQDIDFKKCWALKNLQPLWAADNISKNDSLDKPFQPSLAIGV